MQFTGEQEPKRSEYSPYKNDANKNEEQDDDDYLSETSDKDLSLKRHHDLDINNGRTNDDEDDQMYRKHRDSKNKNYEQIEDDTLNSSKRQHKATARDNDNDESENDEEIHEYMKNNNSTEFVRERDTNSNTKTKDEVCFFMNNFLSISEKFSFSKSLGYCRGNYFTESKLHHMHCMKSVRSRSFSGPYFPAFGLNTERYSVSLRIRSKCGKLRTRKNSKYGQFSPSDVFYMCFKFRFEESEKAIISKALYLEPC